MAPTISLTVTIQSLLLSNESHSLSAWRCPILPLPQATRIRSSVSMKLPIP